MVRSELPILSKRRLGAFMSGNVVLTSGIALVIATLVIRAVALGQPEVDVDEQYYLLVGSRMFHGVIPYVDIWDRKPIGLFLIYAAASALGGSGIIQYQILAAISACSTAWVVRLTAVRLGANAIGAWLCGLAYLLWVNLLGGVGGQAPIFFNLPMAIAGLIIVRAIDAPDKSHRSLIGAGLACMLLVGIAIQIKYTALFEGVFFGLALLALAYLRKFPIWAIALFAAGLVTTALLPTAAASGYYWWIGHFREFVFANFLSNGGRLPIPKHEVMRRAISLATVLLPLISLAALGQRFGVRPGQSAQAQARRFVLLWLIVAIGGVVGFGYFFDHYGLPVVVPAAIAAAPLFSNWRRTRAYIAGLFVIAFGAGQALALDEISSSGGWRTVHAVERATANVRNCPFVYDGPSMVIVLRHWCVPTRYPFPYHLGYYPESRALGVDVMLELGRIMRTHPDAVLIRQNPYNNENLAARTLMLRALKADYIPVTSVPFHQSRLVVFRLKPGIAPQSNDVMERDRRPSKPME